MKFVFEFLFICLCLFACDPTGEASFDTLRIDDGPTQETEEIIVQPIEGETLNELSNESLEVIFIEREAIEKGLSVGKTKFVQEMNLQLRAFNISESYKQSTVPPAKKKDCEFVWKEDSVSDYDCQYLADQALISVFAKLQNTLDENPLDEEKFQNNRDDNEFWFENGTVNGFFNEAAAAVYSLDDIANCGQNTTVQADAYAAGVEEGRILMIDEINVILLGAGLGEYPDSVQQIDVCSANLAILEPSKSKASEKSATLPFCEGYEPTELSELEKFQNARKQFETGVSAGIETEFNLAAEKLFRIIPCNVSDPFAFSEEPLRLLPISRRVKFELNSDGLPEFVQWVCEQPFLVVELNGIAGVQDGKELLVDDDFMNHTEIFFWEDGNCDGVSQINEISRQFFFDFSKVQSVNLKNWKAARL